MSLIESQNLLSLIESQNLLDEYAYQDDLGSLPVALKAFVEDDPERVISFLNWCEKAVERQKAELDFEEHQAKLSDVQAHAHIVLSKHFDKYNAVYSAYKHDDDGNPIDNLDEVAIVGKVRVRYDKYSDSDDYVSEELDCPTWADLLVEFEKAIRFTGDYHHVFLEGVSADDNRNWYLIAGS